MGFICEVQNLQGMMSLQILILNQFYLITVCFQQIVLIIFMPL